MPAFRDFLERLLRGWHEASTSLAVYGFLMVFVTIIVLAALIFLGPVTSQIFQDTQCLQCT